MNSPRVATVLSEIMDYLIESYSLCWLKHCDDKLLSEMDAARLLRSASKLSSISEKIMISVIVGLHRGVNADHFVDDINKAITLDPYNEPLCHNIAVALDSRGYAEEAVTLRVATAQRINSSKSALITASRDCFRYRDITLAQSLLSQLKKIEGRPSGFKSSFIRTDHNLPQGMTLAINEERTSYDLIVEEFKDMLEFDSKIDIASSTVRTFLTRAFQFLRERNYLCHLISHDTHIEHTSIVSTLYILNASETELCKLNDEFCDFVVDNNLFHERIVVLFDSVTEQELNGDKYNGSI